MANENEITESQELDGGNSEVVETSENLGTESELNPGNSVEQETQAEKDWKAEYAKIEKSHKELQSVYGKHTKELGEHRKFKEQVAPYLPYLQALAEQQKETRYQENPELKLKDYIDSQLAPARQYEELIKQVQEKEQVDNTVVALKEGLGKNFDELAPAMHQLIQWYIQNDPERADYLAKNPIALVREAAGELHFHKQKLSAQNNAQLETKRNVAQKTMGSVAKNGVNSNRTSSDIKDMNPAQLKDFLKKSGIMVQPEY